jgi:hypothetical protein
MLIFWFWHKSIAQKGKVFVTEIIYDSCPAAFPLPGTAHRSFRTPTVPGITNTGVGIQPEELD